MKDKEELLADLNKNRVRNINILNFINTYPIIRVQDEGNSILVKGRSDQDWVYISSEDEGEFTSLINRLSPEDKYFVLQEPFMLSILQQKAEIDWVLSCRKLYFPEDINIPTVDCKIQTLKAEQAEYIYEHYEYKQYTSEAYIRDRIEKGVGLGVYEDNKLVAFIITQDDGAMGFLTVLPEQRRKGYAYELTKEMINRLRKKGELPFVHIEENNEKSMNLALKTGFVKDSMVHWVKVK